MNETARIQYLPESMLFSLLESAYTNEIEWIVNGDPHDETPESVARSLEETYQFDPLEDTDPDDIARLWSDLDYPLPSDADDMISYGLDANDIARAALREYAHMYDIEATAETVLTRLRAEWTSNNDTEEN